MNIKKVLLTGGTGYIGSHTAVELISEGFELIIVDNLSNSTQDSLQGIEKITGVKPVFYNFDLCDRDKVYELFDHAGDISAIIHFAALKAVGESVEKPLSYYRNNLISLMNLLEAMYTFKTGNIVFSSSCTVYGQPEKLPVSETAPIKKAESPYGNTKQISEEILKDTLAANDRLKAISLRYFNPIGAHKSAEIGELPLGVPENLVPYVTQTAAGVRDQLRIFGDTYNTPDGTAIRDYINVSDLARAHVAALKRLLENKNKSKFEVFNLGTGKGVSVMEIVKTFEKVTGLKVNYKIVGRREGDIEQVWADTAYANNELGWKSNTSLEDTLMSAWMWEKKLRNL